MMKGNLRQKKYVVAFLDFLGTKEKMKSSEDCEKFLQEINDIYNFINEVIERASENKIANVEIKIFSDNIVLARQIDEDTNVKHPNTTPPCSSVLAFANVFMLESLKRGLWLRGAITIGDFLIDKLFVLGEALTNAYNLENTSAIYPRIIIDQKLVDFIKKQNFDEQILLAGSSSIDFDGVYYLKIFNDSFHFYPKQEQIKIANIIKGNIFAELSKPELAPKYRQKYYWLMDKFNMSCDELKMPEQKITFNENY